MPLIRPLSEADLDRLEQLLGDSSLDGRAFALDALQGFLCAVASAPSPIPEERWLAAALGRPDWLQHPQGEELAGLMRRFHEEILADLVDGYGVQPLLYPSAEDPDRLDLGPWAGGYLEGVELADPAWEAAADPDAAGELLVPFLALSGSLDATEGGWEACGIDPSGRDDALARFAEDLPVHVQEAWDFWEAVRRPATLRREGPKVGRNDPCPCGSGRKYKACHGR